MSLKNSRNTEPPQIPEQARVANLQKQKDAASKALKLERNHKMANLITVDPAICHGKPRPSSHV